MIKKFTSAALGFVLILTFLCSVSFFEKNDGHAAPAQIIVPDQYSTIQEAINNAVDGDTVFVRSGIYYEHVVVNKDISLVGEDVATTIIDGNETGRVINIVSNNINVTGFTVQRSGNISLPDLDAGICLDGTRGCRITGNSIVDNGGFGIHLRESDQNTVSQNSLTSSGGFAISLTTSSENIISSNFAMNNLLNGIGIHALSHDNIISGNTITNSTRHGIMLNNVSNCTISDNHLADNTETGIWMQADSIKNTIYGNNLSGSRCGINIEWANENIVSGNILKDGQTGIQVLNANYTEICNNTITHNYGSEWDAGIRLDYAGYARIFCNNITDNWRGILFFNASPFASIYGNNVSDNEFGIRMRTGGSGYMNLSRNSVMNNRGYGIGLSQGSDYNIISQNNIGLNEYGLFTEYSTQNTIYSNNFIDNLMQASVGLGSFNTWDNGYPSGGNYWSDYSGVDVDGDGIGDTPYEIDEYNVDRYPLVNPWTRPLGDINNDGTVDVFDEILLANAFNSKIGTPAWNPEADLNHDGEIDIFDAILLSLNFGK